MPTPTRSFEVIQRLVAADVEFVVVGMTAGVLQGAPAVTFDLNLLHRRSDQNLDRLMPVLAELDAVFRTDERRLRPQRSHLESAGHKLLMTTLGIVDLLGSVDERTYDEVLEDTTVLDVGDMEIRVLSLEGLIAVKERAGREKDRAVLPLLRATLQRRRSRSSAPE